MIKERLAWVIGGMTLLGAMGCDGLIVGHKESADGGAATPARSDNPGGQTAGGLEAQ